MHPIDKLYVACLNTIAALMDLKLAPDSPEGRLLSDLVDAVREYEETGIEEEEESP